MISSLIYKKHDALLSFLKDLKVFHNEDFLFADNIIILSPEEELDIYLLSLVLSQATRQGHICIPTQTYEELISTIKWHTSLPVITAEKLTERLSSSKVIGTEKDFCPIIFHKNKIYLQKFFFYEQRIAQTLISHSQSSESVSQSTELKQLLDDLFPEESHEINWQRLSAVTTLHNQLSIITGGPGTGKTTTVAKIIVLLATIFPHKYQKILLTAPTGKAANRMDQAFSSAQKTLQQKYPIFENIHLTTSTIHRALGVIFNTPHFRHNQKKPLPYSVIIVDESSMIDIELMYRLLQAIPRKCKLIFLGDHNQLASVQPGAVLGDICHKHYLDKFSPSLLTSISSLVTLDPLLETSQVPPLTDNISVLKKTYRFKGELAKLSTFINQENSEKAVTLLKNKSNKAIFWSEVSNSDELCSILKNSIFNHWHEYFTEKEIDKSYNLFEQFRILSVLRGGPFGVELINQLVENILVDEKIIKSRQRFYHKKPILITENNYNINLFNGDTGIIAFHEKVLKAWFPPLDPTDSQFRKIPLSRLPNFETSYAMTVHKSQGTEFPSLLFILPEKKSELITKELLYTGITRAKENIHIIGNEEIITNCITKRTERLSGLTDTLWQQSS